MKSKTIPYSTQWITPEDIKAVAKALSSPAISQGPEVRRFEEAVAKYCQVKHAVAVSSGTAALHLACLAAGITPPKGGEAAQEVITSPLTFLATANAILYAGGKPVFADIDRATFNLDSSAAMRAITPKTKGIIPVHFAGYSADMKRISELAREHALFVIEDAAHAIGGRYDGAPIGNCRYSDMTIFSFHPVKTITTAEGGMITTNSTAIYEKLLSLRNHGGTRNPAAWQNKALGGVEADGGPYPWYYEMQQLGFNYRLSDLHCALGSSQLKRLDAFVEARNAIAGEYWAKLKDLEPYVVLPNHPAAHAKPSRSAWHLYPILLKTEALSAGRAQIALALRAQGIEAHVMYLPVYLHPYYQGLGYAKGLCPNAEWYYDRVLCLPVHPRLGKTDRSKIIDSLRKIVLKYSVIPDSNKKESRSKVYA